MYFLFSFTRILFIRISTSSILMSILNTVYYSRVFVSNLKYKFVITTLLIIVTLYKIHIILKYLRIFIIVSII